MRYFDWTLRYEAYIKSRRNTPFIWGTNDCALFSCDCVLAITGVDHAGEKLRAHTNAKEAYRVIAEYGGLAAIAEGALGSPIPVLTASVGDIVLARFDDREFLGVCNGDSILMVSEKGLIAMSMDIAEKAWRVA